MTTIVFYSFPFIYLRARGRGQKESHRGRRERALSYWFAPKVSTVAPNKTGANQEPENKTRSLPFIYLRASWRRQRVTERKREKESERALNYRVITHVHIGPQQDWGQSQEPENQIRSPMWIPRIQLVELPSLPPKVCISRRLESRAGRGYQTQIFQYGA